MICAPARRALFEVAVGDQIVRRRRRWRWRRRRSAGRQLQPVDFEAGACRRADLVDEELERAAALKRRVAQGRELLPGAACGDACLCRAGDCVRRRPLADPEADARSGQIAAYPAGAAVRRAGGRGRHRARPAHDRVVGVGRGQDHLRGSGTDDAVGRRCERAVVCAPARRALFEVAVGDQIRGGCGPLVGASRERGRSTMAEREHDHGKDGEPSAPTKHTH